MIIIIESYNITAFILEIHGIYCRNSELRTIFRFAPRLNLVVKMIYPPLHVNLKEV